MSDLANRIKKLEQRAEADEPEVTIIYVYEGRSEAEGEAAKTKAIVEYKSKHPEWVPSPKDSYIQVVSEDTKEMLESIVAGIGTE